jgi:cytochrome c
MNRYGPLAAAIVAIAPSTAFADDAAMIAKGRALVEAKCARCHAIGREDKSPHEKAPPFRDVVEIYPSEDLAEALAEGIVSGHPDMPVFQFAPAEIEAFLGYLNSLASKP